MTPTLVDVSYRDDSKLDDDDLIGLFAGSIQEMPDRFLQCRDIKHPWRIARDYHVVDASREVGVNSRLGHAVYVQRLLICTRCGMQRSDAYVIATNSRYQSLERLNSSYSPPKGYTVKGVGHLSGRNDLVRGEVFRRVVGKLQQAQAQ